MCAQQRDGAVVRRRLGVSPRRGQSHRRLASESGTQLIPTLDSGEGRPRAMVHCAAATLHAPHVAARARVRNHVAQGAEK